MARRVVGAPPTCLLLERARPKMKLGGASTWRRPRKCFAKPGRRARSARDRSPRSRASEHQDVVDRERSTARGEREGNLGRKSEESETRQASAKGNEGRRREARGGAVSSASLVGEPCSSKRSERSRKKGVSDETRRRGPGRDEVGVKATLSTAARTRCQPLSIKRATKNGWRSLTSAPASLSGASQAYRTKPPGLMRGPRDGIATPAALLSRCHARSKNFAYPCSTSETRPLWRAPGARRRHSHGAPRRDNARTRPRARSASPDPMRRARRSAKPARPRRLPFP
jgi:hypothetical protein